MKLVYLGSKGESSIWEDNCCARWWVEEGQTDAAFREKGGECYRLGR